MDGHGSKFTVILQKVDCPDELKDKTYRRWSQNSNEWKNKSERSKSVKVDGPRILMSRSRRSQRAKEDGLII